MQETSSIKDPLDSKPEAQPVTHTSPSLPVDPSMTMNAIFQHQMGHISRHSFVFFLGTIFTAATAYLFKVYLARALGAEALGVYALGMTIIGLLGVFNSVGLPQAATRFVAAYCATGRIDQLRKFLGRSVSLLLISNLSLGWMLLLVGRTIAVRAYHTPALNGYFGLFALIMILGALTSFLGQALAGYKDVLRRTVITNFIGTPLMMVLTIGLIAMGWGLRGYILAQVLSAIAVLGLLSMSVLRLTPAGESLLVSMFSPLEREVVSFSALALGVSLLEFVMSQSDKVLIGVYLNARDVGVYAVAMSLVAFVSIILQSVNQIFSPTIAELHASGQHAMLARLFQTLTKWCLGLTLPLAAVMIIFAPVLMRVFGPDFEIGWPILVIGTIGQVVNCAVGSVGYLLQMSGYQRDLVKIQIFMTLGMLVLALVMIPRWGILGAAAASATTNLVSNLWYLVEVHRKLAMTPYNSSYYRLLFPVTGLLLGLLVGHRFLLGRFPNGVVILASLFGAYVTFVGIALVGGLDSDDRIILNAIWSRTGAYILSPGRGA